MLISAIVEPSQPPTATKPPPPKPTPASSSPSAQPP